tara:strand:+ start:4480 stop:4938 length:459 start_codon:yes stop_codon:yes gene_type:complete
MFVKSLTLVTGGFDPIHSGHIEYFKEASKLSQCLVIGLNSDDWLINKKKQAFQDWDERCNIIKHLNMVSMVIGWDDSDKTACGAIEKCLKISDQVIFANGGDRLYGNTPELKAFKKNKRVIFKWGVGGKYKINSSSWLLNNYYKDRAMIDLK